MTALHETEASRPDRIRVTQLRTQISRRLTALMRGGEIDMTFIHGRTSVKSTDNCGYTTFLVAPKTWQDPHPLTDPVLLDEFRHSLTDPIIPDHEISSQSQESILRGGLFFGKSVFDSVPGFIVDGEEVVPDPKRPIDHRGDIQNQLDLEALAAETGFEPHQLVHRTIIRIVPDSKLLEFLSNYHSDVRENRYPVSNLVEGLYDQIGPDLLELYRANPESFTGLLHDHLRYLRKYGTTPKRSNP